MESEVFNIFARAVIGCIVCLIAVIGAYFFGDKALFLVSLGFVSIVVIDFVARYVAVIRRLNRELLASDAE